MQSCGRRSTLRLQIAHTMPSLPVRGAPRAAARKAPLMPRLTHFNTSSPPRRWGILTLMSGAAVIAGWSALVAGPARSPAEAAGDCTVSSTDLVIDGEEQLLLNSVNAY